MAHTPTEVSRKEVYALSSFGIPQSKIAAYLDIAEMTLRKHYRRELDTAGIHLIQEVANALVYNATEKNNVTAQIFFLKTRGGWREADPKDDKPAEQSINKIQIEVLNGKATEVNEK